MGHSGACGYEAFALALKMTMRDMLQTVFKSSLILNVEVSSDTLAFIYELQEETSKPNFKDYSELPEHLWCTSEILSVFASVFDAGILVFDRVFEKPGFQLKTWYCEKYPPKVIIALTQHGIAYNYLVPKFQAPQFIEHLNTM